MKKIHFVGVGGVGMGTLAKALKEQGHEVTGSDKKLYEPMKSVLETAGIPILEGYRQENLNELDPELVVIGNVVQKINPEAQAWIKSGKDFCSFPEAVRRFLIQDKKSIVCSGTHGKTTTTTATAFLLSEIGMDPSYLIGGVPKNLGQGSVLTSGKVFVGEGDEYDSAFFDKGPKFLHYHPYVLSISGVEFDHADIYDDLEHIKRSFKKLVALVPGDGLILYAHGEPNAADCVQGAHCKVESFGSEEGATWRFHHVEEDENGYEFSLSYQNKDLGRFKTGLFGYFNLFNLTSAIASTRFVGGSLENIRKALPKFQGVRRRQEVFSTAPVLMIDDFAHHPTEVKATLTSVKQRFPNRRLWAFFEPRSATARSGSHQKEYADAFDSADQIMIASPYLSENAKFSSDQLVEALKSKGLSALTFPTVEELVSFFSENHEKTDIVTVMSNGEFAKIQEKLKNVVS